MIIFTLCEVIQYRESVVVNLLILREEYMIELKMRKKERGVKYLLNLCLKSWKVI